MNDSSPYRRAGGPELPPPTLYDPADDIAAPIALDPGDTVVLLLVGEVDRRWAADAAIGMSTAWAASGRRVVLADLHLENPLLHEPLDAENLEGLVDVFLYGASIARSAKPVGGRGFFLIPAGTYTPDVDAIYEHPRWPKLIAGFRDAGASLVLFAPAGAANLRYLAESVSQVVLLGAPRDPAVLAPLSLAGVGLRGLVVPPSADTVPSPAAVPLAAVPAPLPEAPAAPAPVAPDAGLHLPPPPVRTPQRGDGVMKLALWIMLAVAVVAAIAYAAVSLRPDLVPWAGVGSSAGADTVALAPQSALAPRAPTRGGEPLPYSVQVIAYKSLSAATEQLERVRQQVPAVQVFASPEEIQGVLYYKVLAGALPDTALAQQIREVLVASGAINEEDASGAWSLIQHTPLAFDLGEYSTREAAIAAVDSMQARSIPTYPVAVPYSDGTQRWQLYGGAYTDSTTAGAMRRLLTEVGLEPRLVARTGLVVTAQEK